MITISNLEFGYKGHKVFSDLNLSFSEGKIYGLLGLNGAGKSTLLYLMSGLLFAQKGEVMFNGYDMQKRNPNALADLFIVPEEFDLPNMPFDKYIKLNAPFYPKFSNETLDRCLAGFNMDRNMNLKALSMGQKKKAFVCFALATNTQLLIMDEPTNGLDIPSKSQFRKVVSGCMNDERTVIISTHQVRDVENLIDEITIIGDGKLLFNHSVSEIVQHLVFGECAVGNHPENTIFSQPFGVGDCIVRPKMADDSETPLNIEMLFNAVLAETEKIQSVFSK